MKTGDANGLLHPQVYGVQWRRACATKRAQTKTPPRGRAQRRVHHHGRL